MAAAACVYALCNQSIIQYRRIEKKTDVYWWDCRISAAEWVIRLLMVGLDLILCRIPSAENRFPVVRGLQTGGCGRPGDLYFSPDGVGGLKHLTNMLMYLSWLAFVFGLFVFASLYLHWNLREYRTKDFSLGRHVYSVSNTGR